MKISLVKISGVPYSVGVGRYCFPLKDGEPEHETSQQLGAEHTKTLIAYNGAFDLACWAVRNNIYDTIEEH